MSSFAGRLILISLITVPLCAGCIIFPVDYYYVGSRKNISEQTQAKLVVGVTTMEDVLLVLGEPEQSFPKLNVLVYKWDKVKALLLYAAPVPAPNGAGAVEIGKHYELDLTFDTNNILSETNLIANAP
ncbi:MULTISPECIES: hypothetical protein [Paraburkholderia]|jgi:hypothetical protein|uniref:hypothetical protein n=1 Tax=Paraburkholderia TaxID=1822464 RepID=UPI000720921F|nr:MULTISPECIES: hypothetical protein [Paraburkholderia]ALP66021.1 hypothetical protein AN416_26350 [Paraburkholderia caribensis]AUT55049.1 hypothetical protein C2L66_25145 [Paraburkholderia caribensis]CAG9213477.1 conserved hypothetical protein [Paraburkholderia caribensis]